MGLRSFLTLDFYKRAHDHIVEQYPYWNRTSGRDHIWVRVWCVCVYLGGGMEIVSCVHIELLF